MDICYNARVENHRVQKQSKTIVVEMQVKNSENDNFCSRLRDNLELRGWSQSALARETGLSQAVISKYLLAKSEPGAKELGLIAKALDVTMDELWYGTRKDNGLSAIAELTELKRSLRTVFRVMTESDQDFFSE